MNISVSLLLSNNQAINYSLMNVKTRGAFRSLIIVTKYIPAA